MTNLETKSSKCLKCKLTSLFGEAKHTLKLGYYFSFSYSNIVMKIVNTLYRKWHPTPVLVPGESHGWRSLVGCSPWGRWGLDMTERLHFHFSLSCTGEGNGNPLQCSCLENPRDGKPGGLPSMGPHRVGHDWSDLAAAAAQFISYISLGSLFNPWSFCCDSYKVLHKYQVVG